MKTPKVLFATIVAAAVAVAVLAPAANASCITSGTLGCQQVSGTVTSSNLAFGAVAATATLGGAITPGSDLQATGLIPVVSVTPWALSVKDANTNPGTTGHLVRGAGCSGGEAALVNKLTVYPTATLGALGLDNFHTDYSSGAGALQIGGSPQTIATGTLSDVLTANYAQHVNPDEQLVSGCTYSLDAIYTLAPN